MINIPDFYTDPLFTAGQDKLFSYGSGIMEGDIPDFYSIIGQSGSPEFEDMLRMTNRDISRAALEAGAKTRTRGGATASAISKATADSSTKMRWADLLRSIEGKQFLLGTGLNTVGGVRDSALSYGNARSQYGLNKAQLEISQDQFEQRQAAARKAQKAKMWSDILSGVGTVAGGIFAGPVGAGLGSQLGAASGGGSGVSTSSSVLGRTTSFGGLDLVL